jgi:3-deoxy-D-manno-octulosonic-acid transferase
LSPAEAVITPAVILTKRIGSHLKQLTRKAIFLLYRILQTLASPVILFYLLSRALRNRQYFSTLAERCGLLPPLWQQTVAASIWLHAVSVGEILAAVPLISELKQRNPGTAIFVSTTTLAGRETGLKRLDGIADRVFFAPFDFVWAIRRVMRRLRPSVVVILETEIWPNFFNEAKRLGCGLIMINGRISDRALPRYRRFAPLFSVVLGLCDQILTQSEQMRERFIEAGAPRAKVTVGGNLKYDFEAPAPATSPFLATGDSRPVWIAASTSADDRLAEEDFVIEAQRQLPGWRLIIAPRKPGRFDDVARRLDQSGLLWTRRTDLQNPNADVLLLDSIGELSGFFAAAQVVFMGGTLAALGGHNILEPAIFGKAIIAGPHMENFRDIEEHFEQHNAIRRIASGDQLREAVLAAAADPGLGERARQAALEKRGATARATSSILSVYDSSYPCDRPPQPVYGFLWCLSRLWKAGSAVDRHRKRGRMRKLPVPVISIGNITAGGTGKTPAVIELLRDFRDASPGMLTRGHGRSTRGTVLLLDSEKHTPLELTGEEAQLCSRGARVPIGIDADRHVAGTSLLAATNAQVLFLDDGFQHLQLYRDFDLVLIDGLSPFGGGHLLPLGRLREPLQGLARAHAFLLTRTKEAPNTRAIETVLRRYNPQAPVFHSRIEIRYWCGPDGVCLRPDDLKGEPSVAFCGLGNPESFWRSLHRIGIEPLAQHSYEDHHRYSPAEIRRLARHALDIGAKVLLTTAKDAVNLAPDYPTIIAPLKLYWLEIGLDIDRRDELIALIGQKVLQAKGSSMDGL